jgi:hypothetical protein
MVSVLKIIDRLSIEIIDGLRWMCRAQALAKDTVLTRAKLRDTLSVKNERLGDALESLEQAGRIRRTPAGWQRIH